MYITDFESQIEEKILVRGMKYFESGYAADMWSEIPIMQWSREVSLTMWKSALVKIAKSCHISVIALMIVANTASMR